MKKPENKKRIVLRFAVALVVVVIAAAGAHAMMMVHRGVKRPAASEFGLGPRTSAAGIYVVTLEPQEQLRTRRMQSVPVSVRTAQGETVNDASIAIDGGMPQHGHGLPTRPRVTKAAANSAYLIEGLRFNMGGWWEVTLTIDGPHGRDTVTFNLAL